MNRLISVASFVGGMALASGVLVAGRIAWAHRRWTS